jgi:protein-disulfide isomerase
MTSTMTTAGGPAPERRRANRRLIGAGVALTLMAGAANAFNGVMPNEMALGNPRAKVTVTEYASLGCPHCATWEQQVFPAFRKTYIDTGKVRFVLKEMLFGNSTLAAAGFLTARCAGPDKYFQVVDAVFDQQTQIEKGGVDALFTIAQGAGLNKAKFTACLQDEAALKTLQARTDRYVTDDKINGTPTFVVGDKTMVGDQTLAALSTAIDAAQRR